MSQSIKESYQLVLSKQIGKYLPYGLAGWVYSSEDIYGRVDHLLEGVFSFYYHQKQFVRSPEHFVKTIQKYCFHQLCKGNLFSMVIYKPFR